jgi:oligopeptide/dipeptide ABC transporter ATP-binding protein
MADRPLLEVTDLKKHYPIRQGVMLRQVGTVQAVDGVSFSLVKGETLGLVGESGCGKSTTGRTILQLVHPTSGRIVYDGHDISGLSNERMRPWRKRMQMVFQDPYASLDPRMTVGQIVSEPLIIHKLAANKAEREGRTIEILESVGLGEKYLRRYPYEFSGGQRQRIGIARALVVEPELIVADEPVSALDVSIQAQVLNLLQDLKAQFELTYLFIAHDLSVVRHISDRVAVMYLGKIAELAPTEKLFDDPLHPYTLALLSAVPTTRPHQRKKRIPLPGDVPSPVNPPAGCRFHTRCPFAEDVCRREQPELREIEPGHQAACHFALDIRAGRKRHTNTVAEEVTS